MLTSPHSAHVWQEHEIIYLPGTLLLYNGAETTEFRDVDSVDVNGFNITGVVNVLRVSPQFA